MSSNSRLILFFLILLLSINIYAKEQKTIDKTSLMLLALDYENKKQYKESYSLYSVLFNFDKKYEYLKHMISISILARDFNELIVLTSTYKDKFPEHEEELRRLEIVSLLNNKNYDIALKQGYQLLKKFNNSKNNEILATILFSKKNYSKSIKYLESAYISTKNPNILLKLVDILYTQMNKKEIAISYLENHIVVNNCDLIICDRLLIYYQENNNLDGMVSLLKKIYKKVALNKGNKSLDKIINIIVDILKIKDLNNAIEFLEDNKIYDTRILSLYHQTKQYKKALQLTRTLYSKTKDVNFLAQLTILEYESSTNKEDILDKVISNFDIVLKSIDNHFYQNYLGYLLIDYNLNVEKGLMLIKKALKKEATNVAYRDSLAWGYYKQKECKKASIIIEKLKNEVGLDDIEIKKHYNAIKECK
jgi:tetratricopeptide (TPR) repeat protein